MIFSKIMDLFEWVMYFAFLNLLFIAGIIVGGVVLGFFPACFATIITAKRLVNEPGFHVGKMFIDTYKANFWKSQRVGYFFFFINLVAASNVMFWRQLDSIFSLVWLIIFVFIMLGSSLLFSMTIENAYTFKQLGKLFFYSLGQLHLYIALLLGLLVIYLATLMMPGVFIFFVGSLTLTWVMFISHLFIKKIEKVSEKFKNTTHE